MQRSRIMIIEDDATLLHSITFTLKRKGYEIIALSDPREASKVLERVGGGVAEPDLLVTDLQMPGIDGVEIIRGIRRQGMRLPVLVITAFGSAEIRNELATLGVIEVIDKPFTTREFLSRVEEMAAGRMVRNEVNAGLLA